MRTSQAYLPLSGVRRIIAGKKLRTTIAQQLGSCCATATYKSDIQANLSSQSWNKHQPKMKIFELFSLFIFSAAEAQFFGVEPGYNTTGMWEKGALLR